ncbi:hypothetical protein [Paracoccus aminophilus]|uniref:Uncharacterized protein n=1 Tax=Paracoccus aminophilus JCM 7686 TaxID=1367847 RepID=S5Y689_PARAH|nr:hypothetical protein [Paracoccus aminophilus]AGT11160.1 hypothetical protein JCM7686_pAMI5p094 [Paracoccus aminophilus JCM 7686]
MSFHLRLATCLMIPLSLALPCAGSADPVSDALNAAQSAYRSGDLAATGASLITASTELRRIETAKLRAALPDAPSGWSRQITETGTDDSATAAATLLSGPSIEATYVNGDSDAFTLTYSADNPVAGTQSNAYGDPKLMALLGKVVDLNGVALLDQNDTVTAMLANRVLVQAEGMSFDKMRPVLERIDFKKLGSFDK